MVSPSISILFGRFPNIPLLGRNSLCTNSFIGKEKPMSNRNQTLLEFFLLIVICLISVWMGAKVLAYITGISAFVTVPIRSRRRAKTEG